VKEQAHPLLPPLINLVLPVGAVEVVETGNDDAEGDNGVEVSLLTEGEEEVSWHEEHEQDKGGDDTQKTGVQNCVYSLLISSRNSWRVRTGRVRGFFSSLKCCHLFLRSQVNKAPASLVNPRGWSKGRRGVIRRCRVRRG
jgi:hypothetical protein